MNSSRIAIIGLGGIGARHAESILQNPEMTLVAGVDINPAQREQFEQTRQLPTFETAEALFSEKQVDAVVISTPPVARLEPIEAALKAGCHILSEKPLAIDLREATLIRDLQTQHPGSLFHVGYCHRFTGAAQKSRELIEAGSLGDVIWIHVVFSSNTPQMEDRWSTNPAVSGGGAAMDNACHAIDLFQYLANSEISARGFYRNSWPNRGEDSFSISLASKNQILGSVLGSYLSSTPRLFWEICGSKGTLRFDYAGPGDHLQCIHADGSVEQIPVLSSRQRFARQIEIWGQAIHGKATDLATLNDGYQVSTIMEQLKESSELQVS